MRRARTSHRRGQEAALARFARSARDARRRVRQALRLLQPGPRLLHRQSHGRTTTFFATVPRMTAHPSPSRPSAFGSAGFLFACSPCNDLLHLFRSQPPLAPRSRRGPSVVARAAKTFQQDGASSRTFRKLKPSGFRISPLLTRPIPGGARATRQVIGTGRNGIGGKIC